MGLSTESCLGSGQLTLLHKSPYSPLCNLHTLLTISRKRPVVECIFQEGCSSVSYLCVWSCSCPVRGRTYFSSPLSLEGYYGSFDWQGRTKWCHAPSWHKPSLGCHLPSPASWSLCRKSMLLWWIGAWMSAESPDTWVKCQPPSTSSSTEPPEDDPAPDILQIWLVKTPLAKTPQHSLVNTQNPDRKEQIIS